MGQNSSGVLTAQSVGARGMVRAPEPPRALVSKAHVPPPPQVH